jgi:hypothetical protein
MRFYNFLVKSWLSWLFFIENKYRLNQNSAFKVPNHVYGMVACINLAQFFYYGNLFVDEYKKVEEVFLFIEPVLSFITGFDFCLVILNVSNRIISTIWEMFRTSIFYYRHSWLAWFYRGFYQRTYGFLNHFNSYKWDAEWKDKQTKGKTIELMYFSFQAECDIQPIVRTAKCRFDYEVYHFFFWSSPSIIFQIFHRWW